MKRSFGNLRPRGAERHALMCVAAALLMSCATPEQASAPDAQAQASARAPRATQYEYEEVELRFMSGGDELVGTLSVPQARVKPAAGVLLLHDVGPMDRDATQQGEPGLRWAQPVAPHRDLAHALARRGFVVLRYDKRTCVAGNGSCVYPERMAHEAALKLEQDARAALKALSGRPEVDPSRLGVVGHGEGAELALLIGERSSGVRGLVLLAPSPYPIDALIRHQHASSISKLEQQLGAEPDSARADLWRQHLEALKRAQAEEAKLEAIRRGEGVEEVFDLPASSWRASWTRHERAMERLGAAPGLVALFGDRDEALPMEAARAFAQRVPPGAKDRELRVLTGVSHGMIEVSSGVGLGQEVAALVVEALVRRLADGSTDNKLTL